MAGVLFQDVQKFAHQGAGILFTGAVRRIYHTLTGEEPKGDPLRLLERLFAEDRLTPDAALYLLAIARALGKTGRTEAASFGIGQEWRDRVEAIGRKLAAQLVRASIERR